MTMTLISEAIDQVILVENSSTISEDLRQAAGFIFGPDYKKCSPNSALFFHLITGTVRPIEIATSDENNGDEYEVNLSNNQAQFITLGPVNHTFVVYKHEDQVYIAQSWTEHENGGFSFESDGRAEPVRFNNGEVFSFKPGFEINITKELLKGMKVVTARVSEQLQ